MRENNEVRETSVPLREQIESFASKHMAEFPAEVLKLFADKSEEVLQSGIVERSPKVGAVCPDFELDTSIGTRVQLGEKLSKGPVILNFYRGSWCHFCSLEFQSLLMKVPEFQSRGASVLAISPQVHDLSEIPGHAQSGFVNLIDRGNQLARQFGLVYPLGDEIKSVYEKFGIRLDQLNEDDSYEVPVPASYVVDKQGVIRYAYASADLTDRAEPEDLLETVKGLSVASSGGKHIPEQ